MRNKEGDFIPSEPVLIYDDNVGYGFRISIWCISCRTRVTFPRRMTSEFFLTLMSHIKHMAQHWLWRNRKKKCATMHHTFGWNEWHFSSVWGTNWMMDIRRKRFFTIWGTNRSMFLNLNIRGGYYLVGKWLCRRSIMCSKSLFSRGFELRKFLYFCRLLFASHEDFSF